ncbi:MAG: hypothetical protein DI539_15800 [Flavobacterium psychrophilum]|nr:MAG: hypothetical protein DI539_15800 [Flavobacterium psychrophilum]
METLLKEIDSANYLDIFDNDLHNLGYQRSGGKNALWVARINDYKTAKEVDREFLPYPEAQLEVSQICIGDILQVRHDYYESNRYRTRYESTLIVREINDNEVVFDKFKTLFSAWKVRKSELLKEQSAA